MVDVPILLRDAREKAGLTQAELAARAATSQSAVARYESGASSPAVSTLERLLGSCGVRLDIRTRKGSPADLRSRQARLLRTNRSEILRILNRRGFHSPRVFGSVATGTARDDSDIDIVVLPAGNLDLLNLAGAREELSELLGVPVDLAVNEVLKAELRQAIDHDAVPL
jgi:predicted nucleotidyltransferase/DNA-binding XRE family transcriptional regulator